MDQEQQTTPQFRLILSTNDGDHLMASSDTVNDLVLQTKLWMNASSGGARLSDTDVRAIILQELDPATGNYVNGETLPVEDRKDVITQARNLGAR